MTDAVKHIDDGGSAYPLPVHLSLEGDEHIAYPGMSLRDWFAGQALTGLTTNGGYPERYLLARDAYKYADLMIAARKAGA